MSTRKRTTGGGAAAEAEASEDVQVGDGKDAKLLVDQRDKWRKWWTRTYTTVGMIAGFAAIIYFGHLALVAFILVLQVMGFKEILQIRHEKLRMDRLPRDVPIALVDWFLFGVYQYFIIGMILTSRFPAFFMLHPLLTVALNHHSLIVFSLLIVGVVAFVITLRKGFYKMQFKQVAWCGTCLLAMAPSSFHVHNIFEGMIWFLLPCSIIVCNDITAFIWGFWIGRTPLIQLSPKKTWEGFIGAFFSTLLFAWIFSWFLVQFDYFICPKTDMLVHPASCPPQPVMTLTTYAVPEAVSAVLEAVGLHITSVTVYPMQLHALVFAAFGSLIAPFGGFVASGFKRAFGIKDFGDLFPGHGGIVDRMDCQVIMSGFSYVYHISFVKTYASVTSVMAAIALLSPEDQLAVYQKLSSVIAA